MLRVGWACGLAIALTLCSTAPAARAQETTAEATARAREHYDRGVGLFDEGQFVAALAEFEAAFALTRRPSLLFNVGQIHARLGHAVEATDAFERYLRETSDVPAERRALVESELTTQRARIARVTVAVSVVAASISLDDVTRGQSPLAEPLRVSAGEHVLVVSAAGHETSRQRFRIAGGETQTIEVELLRVGPVTSGAAAIAPPRVERPFPALTAVGATIAGAGLVTFAVGGLITLLEHASLTAPGTGCSPSCTPAQTNTIATTRIVTDVGLGVLVIGGVLTVIGAVLELGSSSEDGGPRVSLGAGDFEVWW